MFVRKETATTAAERRNSEMINSPVIQSDIRKYIKK